MSWAVRIIVATLAVLTTASMCQQDPPTYVPLPGPWGDEIGSIPIPDRPFENPFDASTPFVDAGPETPTEVRCDFVELRGAPRVAGRRVEKIVGGVVVKAQEQPWAVSMQANDSHYCTGSALVAADSGADEGPSSTVLTAGHCAPRPGETVVWGCEDLRSGTCKRSKVTRAIRLAGYSEKTLDYDVALVSIDPPADVHPIAILAPQDLCPNEATNGSGSEEAVAACEPLGPGTEITAAGWGVTQEGGWQTSPKLLKVELKLISWTECRASYPDLTERMMCADENKKGSCQGDSGGSAVVLTPDGHRLAGDVSFGFGCAREEWPGVYGNLLVMREQVLVCQSMLEDGA